MESKAKKTLRTVANRTLDVAKWLWAVPPVRSIAATWLVRTSVVGSVIVAIVDALVQAHA